MNRILDQYIFKKFISSLLIALSAFIIIFLIVSIIDFLDKFIQYNLTSKEILLYYMNLKDCYNYDDFRKLAKK